MHVRLGDGVWAQAADDGVHIAILSGDFSDGWRSDFAFLPSRCLPAVARRLNCGGVWSDGDVSLSANIEGARVQVAGGAAVILDDAASARLQVLCTLTRNGLRPAHVPEPDPALAVEPGPDGLIVFLGTPIGYPLGRGEVRAHTGSHVAVDAGTARGSSLFSLPALPVLVAAAEAARDGEDLQIFVPVRDAGPAVVRLDPAAAQQAAAEAQWLLPAFDRHLSTPTAERDSAA